MTEQTKNRIKNIVTIDLRIVLLAAFGTFIGNAIYMNSINNKADNNHEIATECKKWINNNQWKFTTLFLMHGIDVRTEKINNNHPHNDFTNENED